MLHFDITFFNIFLLTLFYYYVCVYVYIYIYKIPIGIKYPLSFLFNSFYFFVHYRYEIPLKNLSDPFSSPLIFLF